MTGNTKLILIKSLHTLIWLFYYLILFYLLYAVIVNKIDMWVWICVGFVLFEGLVLAINKLKCPLTLVAEKYTAAKKDNFDIYLPNWLAKYNKIIYTLIFAISVLILIFRLLNK
ncbi:MAG: hypothetical protein P4L34_04905 [Paludibacter sp.]|nr:hypothetical protein [Paludibacter sp.]